MTTNDTQTTSTSTAAAPIATTIATATEYGSSGPYSIGYEHTAQGILQGDGWAPLCAVLRPIVRRRFLGYGLTADGVATAVMATTHDGPMTPWRSGPAGGPLIPSEKPMHPPYMNLPDEEHGYEWGDDLAVPSTEPARFEHDGREIDAATARRLVDEYIASQPEWQRETLRRDMERAWPASPSPT